MSNIIPINCRCQSTERELDPLVAIEALRVSDATFADYTGISKASIYLYRLRCRANKGKKPSRVIRALCYYKIRDLIMEGYPVISDQLPSDLADLIKERSSSNVFVN
jgi:hypothetical protein